jgi:predicted dehydrogenase
VLGNGWPPEGNEKLMKRPRIAVVGVGHLGKEHVRILSGLRDVELAGIADVAVDQAEALGRRFGCPAYGNHRPLLHVADAAVIVVPTIHHFAVAAEFLRCGIPVLVEKPLAPSLEQAEELVDLARKQGLLLQVGHIERFNPAFEQLQRCPLRPKFIQGRRLGPFTGRSTDIGVVLDLMIHDLDAILALVQSPVRSVEALGVSVFGGHEDLAETRLTFANGCVAHLTASRAHPQPERRMDLWGAEGYAGVDFAKRLLTLIQPSDSVRHNGLTAADSRTGSLKDELFGRDLQVFTRECHSDRDQLTAELRDFIDCLTTGARPRVSGEDGRDALALAARILDRIQQHAWEGHAGGPKGPSELPAPQGLLFPALAARAAA